MLTKSLVALAPLAALFVVACSDGAKPHDDEARIVPEGIDVSEHAGNNSVFSVVALTIEQASNGPELYAAVKNVGDAAGCNPSFSVTLYDKDEQTVGVGVSGLMVRSFYRVMSDGNIAGCVLPGDTTMIAITSLSMDVPISVVKSVVYSSQYWTLPDVEAIDGASLSQVQAVKRSGGVAYTGALVNHFDTPLSNPTVAVYPLNAVGRPLGVAYGGATLDLAPGDSWDFETSTVSDAGVGFDAYPLGGP